MQLVCGTTSTSPLEAARQRIGTSAEQDWQVTIDPRVTSINFAEMSKTDKTYPFLDGSPRPATHRIGKTRSLYLTMRDGVKIAIDVTLPEGADSVPTIVRKTRYHRRMIFRGAFRHPKLQALVDQHQRSRQYFVRRGYAWVDVCARGSGASSGFRKSPWSLEEIEDGREIVDWIVEQAWSNGRVGARGISYDGTAAEYMLYPQHPAIRAVAPRFAAYDVYADIGMPGGISLDFFVDNWAAFNDALDRNRFDDVLRLILSFSRDGRKQLAQSAHGGVADRLFASALRLREPAARLMAMSVPGVAPVDSDDGRLVRKHLKERAGNLNVAEASSTMEFRDDTNLSPHDPELSIDTFSPHTYAERHKGAGAAVYHYSGWFDGAYQLSAIKRFHHFEGSNDQLIVGPWEHSGRQNISPWETSRDPLFDHDAELLSFFDQHLLTDAPGTILEPSERVRYYVMGREQWDSAPTWPPPGTRQQTWYFGGSETLTLDRARRADDDARVVVAGRHGTGRASRWRSLLPMLSLTHYTERSGPDIASFISQPLTDDLEVVGHPIFKVKMSSTTSDPRLFVYLEDVAPNGEIHYVTEGLLRARDRREKRKKPSSHKDIPFHSFRRADAQTVDPGEAFTMTLDLLPTAYRFRKGHSLRLTLAGQDADHFELGPNGTHHIELGACRLDLPVVDS